jgi:hypothetical protein
MNICLCFKPVTHKPVTTGVIGTWQLIITVILRVVRLGSVFEVRELCVRGGTELLTSESSRSL